MGAAGSVMSYYLAEAGWKVLSLEEGPWYSPFRDYSNGMPELVPSGVLKDPHTSTNAFMTKAIGGSMVFYAGIFFRLHTSDFRTRSEFGCGTDWPLSYEELAPFYTKVEVMTGASGSNTNPFEAPREPYPNPPHIISGAAWMFRDGAIKCGYHPAYTPSSILSRPYRGRPSCTYCNMCGDGCMIGDKSSPEMTFAPAARKKGADIRPGHKVMEIETNNTGRVTGVVYKDSRGVRQRAESDLVVLCAGAAHNPIILERSRSKAHREGLGAGSGLRGRNLMLHNNGRYMTHFDRPVKGYMGVSGGVCVQDFYNGYQGADFERGYTLYVSMVPTPPSRFADWYFEKAWGKELLEGMDGYDRMIRIAVVGEDQAREDNRMESSSERKDEDGFPLAQIRYKKQDNEIKQFAHAVETSRKICKAAGSQDWELFWAADSSAHILGTCRMGDDPSGSVVDKWGACHDVPGLYICDGSIFPTSGAVNPACTVMALSARTADHLVKGRG